MENNEIENRGKKDAITLIKINFSAVALMVLCSFNGTAAILAFILGMILALINFIMMIVYITQKKPYAYMTCMISMLLLPIIGFGCCAAGANIVI